MEYICKKCGDRNEGRTEIKGNQIGLYCTNCGGWIKWLPKDEYARRSDKPLNTIEYHCCEMRRNCEHADKFGNCTLTIKGARCEYRSEHIAEKVLDLPNELTINGVVYVKKGEK